MKKLSEEELAFIKQKFTVALLNSKGTDHSMWTNILLKLNTQDEEVVVPTGNKTVPFTEKVSTFSNSNLNQIRGYVETACEDLKKVGLGVAVKSFKYTATKATANLEIYVLEGDVNDPYAVLRADYLKELNDLTYQLKGFKPEHFLKEFTRASGIVYQFVGFIPKGKKYIYKALRKSDGVEYKFTADIEKLIL